MSALDEIQRPIAAEMRAFEQYFRAALKSENLLLDRISHYIIKRKGKQIRPMFVFLSSKLFKTHINEASDVAASLIELLHTATLVHDDVVDDAQTRRGFFSINALWKNKIAVLVGDYLLSRGLLMSVEAGQFQLLRIMSTAVKEMSEGELLQQEKSRLLNISEEVYYQIIRQKTASLIAACCESGAVAGDASDVDVARMREFGMLAGMAFQVKDDLFDYGLGKGIGKPTGIDIQERKMTLPLIYALNKSSRPIRRELINTVKNHNQDSKRVNKLLEVVTESGGIEYAARKMAELRDKALQTLESVSHQPHEECADAKQSLIKLVNFTIDREK